jgi:hypothetical protein
MVKLRRVFPEIMSITRWFPGFSIVAFRVSEIVSNEYELAYTIVVGEVDQLVARGVSVVNNSAVTR